MGISRLKQHFALYTHVINIHIMDTQQLIQPILSGLKCRMWSKKVRQQPVHEKLRVMCKKML